MKTSCVALMFVVVGTIHAQPPRRAHHSLVYDAARERVVLTGGSTPLDSGRRFEFFNDVWEFDGQRWTARATTGSRMSGIALAFDPDRSRILAFGGFTGASSVGDFRWLSIDKWEPLPSGPPAVAEPGMVYDVARKRVVAFGGSTGPGASPGATWEFDGERWIDRAIAAPPARQAMVIVYDTKRRRTVVFGGMGTAPAGQRPPPLGDTWEYDGERWTRVATTGPSPRFAAGAAYDSKRGVVIIFGGLDSTGFRGDTWSWDGSGWTKLSEVGPSPRGMGYLAYDARRDRVVMFGGRTGWPDGDRNDTWEWDGSRWSPHIMR